MESLNGKNDINPDIKFAIRALVDEVKEELDEHLESINQNTNEISSNYEYLCEFDYKINKLSEKIEQIHLFLEDNFNFKLPKKPKFEPKPLSNNEQDVFLILYTLEEKKGSVSYPDIAKRIGLSEELVSQYITRMIEKNVPIIKRYVNNKPFLRLDPQFKRIQAKENILGLNQRTMSSY
ncbi:MAG: winged helix-turn-helix domain-containing protein [Nanoarchaeota archaeon]|nr:winged helix-turn-helix domain-containing protein [Nanoarchaeota archaeon]